MFPSPRSECVQRCSEKSISFQALYRALELNEKIFSAHKPALRGEMWWPAVPPRGRVGRFRALSTLQFLDQTCVVERETLRINARLELGQLLGGITSKVDE